MLHSRLSFNQRLLLVFIVTYLAYAQLHVVRRPLSIVKPVLHPSQPIQNETLEKNKGWAPFNADVDARRVAQVGLDVYGLSHAEELPIDGPYYCASQPLPPKAPFGCNTFSRKTSVKSRFGSLFEEEQRFYWHVSRVQGEICKRVVDSRYVGKYCWVVHSTVSSASTLVDDSAIVAAQLQEGVVPLAVSRQNQATLAWKRRSALMLPIVFVADPSVGVVPRLGDGKVLLGALDTATLMAYAFGLVVSGVIADRVNIAHFLAAGMLLSGLASIAVGLAGPFGVHNFSYFFIFSLLLGLFMGSGWPSVIAVLSRWFPKDYPKRGLVFGVWNTNLFLGNILGALIATWSLEFNETKDDWPLAYYATGICCILGAIMVFFLLEPERPNQSEEINMDQALLLSEQELDREEASETGSLAATAASETQAHLPLIAGFGQAISIPGVIPYSVCVCFAKMGSTGLLFWSPMYLASVGFSNETAGYLCSFVDVGGLLGGVFTGFISDLLPKRRGLVAFALLLISCPSYLAFYSFTDGGSTASYIVWMLILGFIVNGPVVLITTAVSADLGQHPSLKGDERLLGQVAGLIDGAGAFGSALSGIVFGYISSESWSRVFTTMSIGAAIAAVCLVRVVGKEREQGKQ